uniref:Uncharacterized protein n=1 Tax=Arundo donax TaxID=35708 RepID=A0A0A9AIN3_ARUDO
MEESRGVHKPREVAMATAELPLSFSLSLYLSAPIYLHMSKAKATK